jgi:hypothetical protein
MWARPLPEPDCDVDLIDGPIEWTIEATDTSWRKWLPSNPTSPHWYDGQRLGRLIGANIAHAEDNGSQCPTVLAFIREFRGLSSTARAKAICDSVGAARQSLSDFAAGADLESFDYRRAEFEHEGLPYLAEFAFGFCPDGPNDRRIVTGVNWGVSIGSDPFRRLGPAGESLSGILTKQRLGRMEPVVTVLHLSCPRVAYLDRGKSSVLIPGSRSW